MTKDKQKRGSAASEAEIATVSGVVGEGAAARRMVHVGAWRLTAWMGDAFGEPRILDTDLGARLGYARPDDCRALVKRMLAAGKLNGSDVYGGPPETSERGGRPSAALWLSAEAATLVATQSGTETAWALTREMARVYGLARRGLLPQQAPGLTREEVAALIAENNKPVMAALDLLKQAAAHPAAPPADDGVGRHVADRELLAPLRLAAKYEAQAIGKDREQRVINKMRFLKERALRRAINFTHDKGRSLARLPSGELRRAVDAVTLIVSAAFELRKASGYVEQPDLLDVDKVRDIGSAKPGNANHKKSAG